MEWDKERLVEEELETGTIFIILKLFNKREQGNKDITVRGSEVE
jgi:hypothetical protein